MWTFTRLGPRIHPHLLKELHLGYDEEMMLPAGVAAVAADVAAGTVAAAAEDVDVAAVAVAR